MINRTPFKPSYVAGPDLQLPLLLAGARVSTRFASLCASAVPIGLSLKKRVQPLQQAASHPLAMISDPFVVNSARRQFR
jgi:hypothetical protein